jgi:hypothetical protein
MSRRTAGSLIPAARREFCYEPEIVEVAVVPDDNHAA